MSAPSGAGEARSFRLRRAGLTVLFAAAILVGALFGLFLAYESDLLEYADLFKGSECQRVVAGRTTTVSWTVRVTAGTCS